MKNPLENDIDSAPQNKICQSEPWERLEQGSKFSIVSLKKQWFKHASASCQTHTYHTAESSV